jgi:thiol-disulfide isomerase/thioredoxin
MMCRFDRATGWAVAVALVIIAGCAKTAPPETPAALPPPAAPSASATPAGPPAPATPATPKTGKAAKLPETPATPATPPAPATPSGPSAPSAQPAPSGDQIHWHTSFVEAQTAAKAAGKPMVVDFCASWCGPCRMLAEMSFPSPRVQALKNKFVFARIDVDLNPEPARKYETTALPTVIIMQADGTVITRQVGFIDGDALADFLSGGLSKRPPGQAH